MNKKEVSLRVVSVEEDVGLVYMQDDALNTYVMDWNTKGALLTGMVVGMRFNCEVNSYGYINSVNSAEH